MMQVEQHWKQPVISVLIFSHAHLDWAFKSVAAVWRRQEPLSKMPYTSSLLLTTTSSSPEMISDPFTCNIPHSQQCVNSLPCSPGLSVQVLLQSGINGLLSPWCHTPHSYFWRPPLLTQRWSVNPSHAIYLNVTCTLTSHFSASDVGHVNMV